MYMCVHKCVWMHKCMNVSVCTVMCDCVCTCIYVCLLTLKIDIWSTEKLLLEACDVYELMFSGKTKCHAHLSLSAACCSYSSAVTSSIILTPYTALPWDIFLLT